MPSGRNEIQTLQRLGKPPLYSPLPLLLIKQGDIDSDRLHATGRRMINCELKKAPKILKCYIYAKYVVGSATIDR